MGEGEHDCSTPAKQAPGPLPSPNGGSNRRLVMATKGKQMTTTEIIAAYEALRTEYAEYAGEARTCGHEVLSFGDWTGQDSPRRRAEERWQHHFENDTQDLY
jgi:hypothetical protein